MTYEEKRTFMKSVTNNVEEKAANLLLMLLIIDRHTLMTSLKELVIRQE